MLGIILSEQEIMPATKDVSLSDAGLSCFCLKQTSVAMAF